MVSDKAKIRAEALKRRRSLNFYDVKKKSILICEKAVSYLEKINPKQISIYLPYDNEVNTFPIVAYAIFSGIRVFVPVADYEKKVLFHAELKDLSRVKHDKRGIIIPENLTELINEETFNPEIVFCPGIAFDLKGVRIGHGEGYYDRFLAKKKDVLKIGLAFELQLFDELPVESHDVLMNAIITEERIIEI